MGSKWFDYVGESEIWNSIPIRTVKKAFLTRLDNTFSLAKMVWNSITIDFNETAQGGAVIVPPGYQGIEFISPDGRIDYARHQDMTLGESLHDIVTVLNANSIPAWDKFAVWLGANVNNLSSVLSSIDKCAILPIGATDTSEAIEINIPVFTEFKNSAEFFAMIEDSIAPAASTPLSNFRVENKAYGFMLGMTSVPGDDGSVSQFVMGFLFRE